jgi:hypothetical protein
MKRFSYCVCASCGLLVRLTRVEGDQAAALERLNSHAFASECPGCKGISQLTFTVPSPILTPSKG